MLRCWLNFKLLAMRKIKFSKIRVLEEPFQVEHLLNNNVYWCFGYDMSYLYVKKVKSTNKHYKVFKLYALYAVIDKKFVNRIMKSIYQHRRDNIFIKKSKYYNNYNILKNINRKYAIYDKWVQEHNSKVKAQKLKCKCINYDYEEETYF